ncbi:MAG: primosomal protein N' [Oscillospiraceae bacterium]|nr:primosomal protein N' [Oscillospiraceae bacterium]
MVLVPEISLTPQMVDRFLARFGESSVAVLHSKLSVGERYDEWNKIGVGKVKIVIGARSGIFAPISNLGIIIIDEEHDESYKSDMTPRYNAKDIAKYLAKQNNIPIVFGSATPSISSFKKAESGEMELVRLCARANEASLPEVEVVDLRQELANGNRSPISRKLYEAISKNIKNKKQTILFLNRRGFSTFVMCRDCGYTVKCTKCNISLTYHRSEDRLKCHYCGYGSDLVTVCPECTSKNIKHFGSGTQKLETEIKKIFPEASTIRMDVDTVGKKNSHEKILNQFQNEGIDILIGTQMVVKGHHFPNVTLVRSCCCR